MNRPKFSVVIPAYKQADFLGEAIQSVLAQTCPDLEVIVVNDASPDHIEEVASQYSDPRVKYIAHPQNKGLPAARNTGMRESTGEYIALLDADDYFHPDKLMAHLRFFEAHPEIGVTYNPRFELNHSEKTIRELYRPKKNVDLSDLVLGFPFSPSDMVLRRECMESVGLFDETLVNGAEDMDYPCRLALSGCKFASIDQALNYRRYHLNRNRRSMQKRKVEYDMVLNRVFDDPRCPAAVRDLREQAIARRTLNLAFVSFTYEDTAFAQELLREALQRNPGIATGVPAYVVDFFVIRAINNGVESHADLLRRIFDQFPGDLTHLASQYDWAVRQGSLARGARAVIWGNSAEAERNLEHARRAGAAIDELLIRKLLTQLQDIDEVLGADAFNQAVRALFPALRPLDRQARLRELESQLFAARAFSNYRKRNYNHVQRDVLAAIRNNPKICLNRGILSIFIRSTVKKLSGAPN